MFDWDKAEQYLKRCESVYAEIGSAGMFAMTVLLRPLRDRYNSGERSLELYDEIMNISL